MFKFILKLFIIQSVLYSINSYARCSLKVACTYDCGGIFAFRLKTTALMRGIKLKLNVLQPKDFEVSSLQGYDAFIIPGGADIDPDYYTQNLSSSWQSYYRAHRNLVEFTEEGKFRDPLEMKFLENYFSAEELKEKPLLGVCRGMQLMSASQGLPLYLDIKTELGIKNRRHLFDYIYPVNDSLMDELFYKNIYGYELHHQGIRVDYYDHYSSQFPQLKITAYSNKNLIAEAIEFNNRPALGVQFHPEFSSPYVKKKVFGWLLDTACKNKEGKQE
jgi:gamma-glutamyl-gamma-aminobutyrate hydrolase PuuD